MKATTKCYRESEFLRVFNFANLCSSQNSLKLDAHEKLMFYNILYLAEDNGLAQTTSTPSTEGHAREINCSATDCQSKWPVSVINTAATTIPCVNIHGHSYWSQINPLTHIVAIWVQL